MAETTIATTAVADLIRELKSGTGYGALRDIVSPRTCERCRVELLKRSRSLDFDVWPGVRSKRIKDPLEWGSSSFADLLNQTTKVAKPVVEAILGPSAWLTSFHALALFPEPERADEEVRALRMSGLHSDFPYGEFKEKMDRALHSESSTAMVGVEGRPMGHGNEGWQFPKGFRPGESGGPHTVQTIWILDLFTNERGATALLPGSFRSKRVPNCGKGDDWDRFERSAVPQTGKKGDILFYVGATWHTIGVNRGRTPRVALLGQWSPHFMCPLEAHTWTTPLRMRRRLSAETKALMGFPGSVKGYSERTRPPHRDGAPRFVSDSARFALDTAIIVAGGALSSPSRYAGLASVLCVTIGISMMATTNPIGTILPIAFAFAIGFVVAAHAVLLRLGI